MNIPFPSAEEQRSAVKEILVRGLPPVHQKDGLLKLLRILSPRVLFFGITDCVFAACVTALLGYSIAAACLWVNPSLAYQLILFLSPALYLLLCSLTTGKEIQENTRVISMTCRYTHRHLTAVRMLYFGAFGAVANTLLSFWTIEVLEQEFWNIWGISLSSLFIYAFLSIFCLLHLKKSVLQLLVPPICWGLGALVVWLAFPGIEIEMIKNMPVWITFAAALFFCAAFLVELYSYYKKTGRENYYAFS